MPMSIAEKPATRPVRRHSYRDDSLGKPGRVESPVDQLERLLVCPCGSSLTCDAENLVMRGSPDPALECSAADEIQYTCDKCGFAGRRAGSQYIFGGFTTGEVKGDWLNR